MTNRWPKYWLENKKIYAVFNLPKNKGKCLKYRYTQIQNMDQRKQNRFFSSLFLTKFNIHKLYPRIFPGNHALFIAYLFIYVKIKDRFLK